MSHNFAFCDNDFPELFNCRNLSDVVCKCNAKVVTRKWDWVWNPIQPHMCEALLRHHDVLLWVSSAQHVEVGLSRKGTGRSDGREEWWTARGKYVFERERDRSAWECDRVSVKYIKPVPPWRGVKEQPVPTSTKIDWYLMFYAQSTVKGHIRARQNVFLPLITSKHFDSRLKLYTFHCWGLQKCWEHELMTQWARRRGGGGWSIFFGVGP